MKSVALMFATVFMVLSSSYMVLAQEKPCPEKDPKTEKAVAGGAEQGQPVLERTLPKGKPKNDLDRAVLEMEFNEFVEEIDQKFHSPRPVQVKARPDLGCITDQPKGEKEQ